MRPRCVGDVLEGSRRTQLRASLLLSFRFLCPWLSCLSLKCFCAPAAAVGVLRKPLLGFPLRFGSFASFGSFSFGSFLSSLSLSRFSLFPLQPCRPVPPASKCTNPLAMVAFGNGPLLGTIQVRPYLEPLSLPCKTIYSQTWALRSAFAKTEWCRNALGIYFCILW